MGERFGCMCYMVLGFFISLPLIIWKLIDIIIWAFSHIHISIN